MSYRDEELLYIRKKIEAFKKEKTAVEIIEKECKQSIHDPVMYITKIPVEFKEQKLLDGQIIMRVPIDFEPLSQHIIEQGFLMHSKPQYVYENSYLPLGLAFTVTDIAVDAEKLQALYPHMLSTLKKMGPGVRIISKEKKMAHGVKVYITEFIAQTMTEPTYNNQFVCCCFGKLLVGNLMCSSVFMTRYKPIMEEMIETFRIAESEKGEDEAQ